MLKYWLSPDTFVVLAPISAFVWFLMKQMKTTLGYVNSLAQVTAKVEQNEKRFDAILKLISDNQLDNRAEREKNKVDILGIVKDHKLDCEKDLENAINHLSEIIRNKK